MLGLRPEDVVADAHLHILAACTCGAPSSGPSRAIMQRRRRERAKLPTPTWHGLQGPVHGRVRPELMHEELPRMLRQQEARNVSQPCGSCEAPSAGRCPGPHARVQAGAPTRKCRSLPGGWLPTMKPHMAATPGSLKVVHSLDRFPAAWQQAALKPFRALYTSCRFAHCLSNGTTTVCE